MSEAKIKTAFGRGGGMIIFTEQRLYYSRIQALRKDKTIPNYPLTKTKPILAKTISIFRKTISNRISI